MRRAPALVRVLVLLGGFGLVAGCSPSSPSSPSVDDPAAGHDRIAVVAPAAAEMLADLGLAQQVVAVGDFVLWPPELTTLPKLGAYDDPNEERVLALGADVLITAKSLASGPSSQRLRSLGVEVIELDTDTYQGMLAAFDVLGRRFGREAEAQRLVAEMERRLDAVRRKSADAPRRKVLFVVGQEPLFVAGPGSHIDQMITDAGGVNVAHDALSSYQLMSLEAVLERQPEVIIDTSDNRPGALRGRQPGSWGRWPFLPAVTSDQVYWVDPQRLVIPGPRLPAMTELMGQLIHPEIFGPASAADLGPMPDAASPAPSSEPLP